MAEIILVIITLICAVADETGAAIFFLACAVAVSVWRRSQLQDEHTKATTGLLDQMDSLRADLAALRKLATSPVEKAQPAATAPPPTPAPSPAPAPSPSPAAVSQPLPKPPEPAPSVRPAERVPAYAASATTTSQPATPAPLVTGPSAPRPPAMPMPPVPPTPAPKPMTPAPPAAAVRPPIAPPAPVLQTSTGPAVRGQLRKALDMEEVLGTNWLNKIGVTILVLGIALFGIYELGTLGALGKVILSLAVSLALLGSGVFLERRERFVILGRTAIGGGWALLFFVSYAINHITAMQVLQSESLDCVLMLGVAIAMATHTLQYKSQLVTGMAFLLAYTTVALSHDTVYSLAAGAILAIGLVAIVIRLSWFELEVFGILASYLNHAYWLYRILGPAGAKGHPFPEFMASTTLLLFYWAIFRVSYVVRKVRWPEQEHISTVAALLNTILLLAVMKFQSARPQLAFYALLALGAVEFTIGQLGLARQRRKPFVLLSIVGAVLMFAAIPFRYSGNDAAVIWLAGAEAFLAAGILFKERLFRGLGLIFGLLVGAQALIVDSNTVAHARMAAEAPLVSTGVLLGAAALVFYLNSCLIGTRWKQLFTDTFDSTLLRIHSYVGAAAAAIACWAAFVGDWTAVAFAAVMIVLALLGRYVRSGDLQAQYGALAILAMYRAVVVNIHYGTVGPHLKIRLITLPILALSMYVTATLAKHHDSTDQGIFRGFFALLGSALVALLVVFEVRTGWQPLAFAVFALLLMEAGRLLEYRVLAWHAHMAAAAALGLGFALDFHANSVRIGLLECVPVVIAMYILALRTRMDESEHDHIARAAYTWLGSAFAVWVLNLAVPSTWVSVAWMVFALLLVAAQRLIKFEQLDWQAYVIAGLACVRAGFVDLRTTEQLAGHFSARLFTVSIVVLAAYAIAQLLHEQQQKYGRDLRLHAWAGAALAVTLMWYELQPISVAVGWSLIGLVLFQYGAWRQVRAYRLQAYLALTMAFARIFFVNLTAESAARFTGPRMTTVLPIAAILFYVYSQIADKSEREFDSARLHVDVLLAYFGTASVAALLYFQFAGDWVVTAWSTAVVALFVLALLIKRELFAQQAVLLTLLALGRALFHNLFGASYFTGTDWRGRFVVLGSAIAVMLLCLPPAFILRRRFAQIPVKPGVAGAIARMSRRPEQVMFFVPVVLLTVMLALKMSHGMVTAAWGIEALLIFVFALLVKERSFRLTGLGILLLCVVKIIGVDAWRLAPRDRYVTFIILGASLLAVSFLYSRYREAIREYL